MTIRKKIILSLSFIALFILLFIIYNGLNMNKMSQSVTQANTQSGIMLELTQARGVSQNITEEVLRMTIHKSDGVKDETVNILNNEFNRLAEIRRTLMVQISDPDLKAELDEAFTILDAVQPIIFDQLVPAINDKAAEAILLSVNDLVDFALKDAQNTLEAKATATQHAMNEQLGSVNGTIQTLTVYTFVAAAVAVFMFIAIFLVIRSSVLKRLKDFIQMVENFTSGDGDLTRRIPDKSKDEFGTLGKLFNHFTENVQGIIHEVNESAQEVNSQNIQLTEKLENISAIISRQNESIRDLALMVSEACVSSLEIVENINNNSSVMENITDTTHTGESKLHNAQETVYNIKAGTEKLSETIDELRDASHSIEQILSVINDIADQTNLLALNAAIEAARAGDAGRGFAVVADEVRKLAERTQKSIGEIDGIVKNLIHSTYTATEDMNNAGESVEQGVSAISETSSTFKEIVTGISGVKELTAGIQKTISGQADELNRVNTSMQNLNIELEAGTNALEELSGNVAILRERATALSRIVNKFKA